MPQAPLNPYPVPYPQQMNLPPPVLARPVPNGGHQSLRSMPIPHGNQPFTPMMPHVQQPPYPPARGGYPPYDGAGPVQVPPGRPQHIPRPGPPSRVPPQNMASGRPPVIGRASGKGG